MSKFITNFATESAYNSAIGSIDGPNVSLTKDTNKVYYKKQGENE
jgi:hypothetical protein